MLFRSVPKNSPKWPQTTPNGVPVPLGGLRKKFKKWPKNGQTQPFSGYFVLVQAPLGGGNVHPPGLCVFWAFRTGLDRAGPGRNDHCARQGPQMSVNVALGLKTGGN